MSYDNYDVPSGNNGADVDDVSNNVVHHGPNDGFQNGFDAYGKSGVDGYGRDVDTFHLPKKFGTDKKIGDPDNNFEPDLYHFVTERSGSTSKDPDAV